MVRECSRRLVSFAKVVTIPKKLYNNNMPEGNKINKEGVEDLEIDLTPEVSTESQKEIPEINLEQHLEQPEKTLDDLTEEIKEAKEGKTGEGIGVTAPQKIASQLPYFSDIEEILEDGLAEAFNQLSPAKQQEFKTKGEETTKNITELLNSSKEKISQLSKKIYNLIINWLKVIPGANKFFLEQEAKIKTDKILALKNKK